MRTAARYLLALTLFGATLCADRALAATDRVDLTPARGLVDRLADGFRRTVATRPIVRQRCPWSAAVVPGPSPEPAATSAVAPPPVCPSHLPLPPPLA